MTMERPLLFSGPMVRAILDGRKTQTRRVVGFKCEWDRPAGTNEAVVALDGMGGARWSWPRFPSFQPIVVKCPCGVPGDRLWVKETFRVYGDCGRERVSTSRCTGPHNCQFRADGSEAPEWRPSLHMPRWASRLTLDVVAVRVERLNEIAPNDCIAEGIEPRNFGEGSEESAWARSDFARLWDSTNKRDPWLSNPWVWVVEFARLKEPQP